MDNEPSERAPISFEAGNFVPMAGFPHMSQINTMPVVHFREGQVRPLGTCFAIGNEGLVVTARHVIEEAFGQITSANAPAPDNESLAAIYISQEIDHQTGHLIGGALPVLKIWANTGYDVALMQLDLPTNVTTGERLRMPAVSLSPGIPKVDQYCFAFGYHSMDWMMENELIFTVQQNYVSSRGKIEEIHFPKRDAVFLSFPCFRTDARFDGGMSGGPIISETGQVCGVVCSSMKTEESDGSYTSYGSLIGPALALILDGKDANGVEASRFLYEFVEGGAVLLDESAKDLNVQRDGSKIILDFGGGRTLSNEIR